MGREQEWKLTVPAPELLDEILRWEPLAGLLTETPRRYRMQTTYYDTADRRLSRSAVTLRRRMENDQSVVCVKAALPACKDPSVHGEWEVLSEDLAAALPELVRLGAPALLLEAGEPLPVCGAAFTRRAALLRFPDGSASELALDLGCLTGPTQTMPLCELELEMKAGAPDETRKLLRDLQARFGLTTQTWSKYQRAKTLG